MLCGVLVVCCGVLLQVRGSVPLFWSQQTTALSPKPDILLQQFDPVYEVSCRLQIHSNSNYNPCTAVAFICYMLVVLLSGACRHVYVRIRTLGLCVQRQFRCICSRRSQLWSEFLVLSAAGAAAENRCTLCRHAAALRGSHHGTQPAAQQGAAVSGRTLQLH